MDELEVAQRDVARAREQVLDAYEKWVEAQSSLIEQFLVDQGRATAIAQSAHTEEIEDQVPGLRDEIAAIAKDIAANYRSELLKIPETNRVSKDYLGMSETFNGLSSIAQPFGDRMIAAGYSPGQTRYASSGLKRLWSFHYEDRPVRSAHLPLADIEINEYYRASREWATAVERLSRLECELSKKRAKDIWS